jgi:acyl-CoA thioesterase-1
VFSAKINAFKIIFDERNSLKKTDKMIICHMIFCRHRNEEPCLIDLFKNFRKVSLIFMLSVFTGSCMSTDGNIKTDRDLSQLPRENFLLRDRKEVRIVCYGDSVTFGFTPFTGIQCETPYPEALEKALNQDSSVRYHCINAGYSGQTSNFGLFNLRSLVLNHQPDLVILMFGINDCNYGMKLEIYRKNFIRMIEEIREAGAFPVILTPTPILRDNRNGLLRDYSRELSSIASGEGTAFFDLQHALSVQIAGREKEFIPDGIHPAVEVYPVIGDQVARFIRSMMD